MINQQADATIASVKEYKKDIPIDLIEIEEISEFEIGKLLFYYELLTSIVGKFLRINTYDQPGVEGGKNHLKRDVKNKKLGNIMAIFGNIDTVKSQVKDSKFEKAFLYIQKLQDKNSLEYKSLS